MQRGELVQDRYELKESVGRGGMAEVWRARDVRLNRETAVKFLAPQLADNPDFLVRFFTEAQTVARISSHPAVVDVLDFGQHDGRPYLVMEYVPGGPLSDIMGRPILPERAFAIVSEAARGLEAAHARGLVHRDIKPGNILLDSEGRAKIADFGIAWSPAGETLTSTGAALGTPHYMPPEHVSGGETTTLSDIYSLGVVLYELLTGRRPFDGDNVTAVAIARVDREPPPPSAHEPSLGPEIDAIVMRCLQRDPTARFQTAGKLVEALHGVLSPSEAGFGRTEVLLAGVSPKDAGQPRFLAAAIVFLVLLTLAGVGVVSRATRSDPPPPTGAAPLPEGGDDAWSVPSPTPSGEPLFLISQPGDDAPREGEDEKEEARDKSDESPAPESSGPEPTPTPEETASDEDGENDVGDHEAAPTPSPTPEDPAP